jgi:hypothetical protein
MKRAPNNQVRRLNSTGVLARNFHFWFIAAPYFAAALGWKIRQLEEKCIDVKASAFRPGLRQFAPGPVSIDGQAD